VPAGHPVADVLRLLAGCDSTGVLHVPGPPAGAFHLDGGRVAAVSTDAVPPGAGRRPVLDATLALLGGARVLPPRFTTGGPAAPGGPRWDVAGLLAEVEQARAVLAAAGVGPDDEVALRPLTRRSVRVDAGTWPVIGALATGGVPTTPRRLAWALGATVLDTVLAVADVVDQGAGEVLRTAAPAAPAPAVAGAGRDPGTVPIPVVGQAPRRDRTPRPAPGPLPVRRPGASLPAPGSRGRPGGPGTEGTGGFTAVPADLPAEIVLRLLDGLRRL